MMKKIFDGEDIELHEGDRVYSFDVFANELVYGTLLRNEYFEVSAWHVKYDDGQDCAVLDFKQLWKA